MERINISDSEVILRGTSDEAQAIVAGISMYLSHLRCSIADFDSDVAARDEYMQEADKVELLLREIR
jgi:hypothetical protein